MRWFVLIVASIGFLASTGASIAIYILTKNPLPFAVPSTIMIAMRPIIHFLFTQDGHEHNKKRVPHRIASNITSLPRRPES